LRIAAALSVAGLYALSAVGQPTAAQTPDAASSPTGAPAPPTPSPRSTKTGAAAKPRSSAPLDFSGTWEFDEKTSINANYHYIGSVLSVAQSGNHIWIQPVKQGRGSGVLAEEIVADGRPYEKAMGPAGKGTVTAEWSEDKTALRIEVRAGPEGKPSAEATQSTLWRLSADRKLWLRESTSTSQGQSRSSRLVFRRISAASLTPSAVPAPRSTPKP
jgi:hypothetical protein